MASKYVTDDGLDLDSRYLGINAKAKSAETADSVNWDGVTGVPTGIESAPPVLGTLKFTSTASYSPTSDVMIYGTVSVSESSIWSSGGEFTVYLDNVRIGSRSIGEQVYTNGWTEGTLFLRKGQVLKYAVSRGGFSKANFNYTAIPIKLA